VDPVGLVDLEEMAAPEVQVAPEDLEVHLDLEEIL